MTIVVRVRSRCLGRFTFATVLAVPSFCSATVCALLASHRLVAMFAHGLLTLAIEVSVARGDGALLRLVRDSPRWRTAAFMLTNAWLMCELSRSVGRNLWLLQPVRSGCEGRAVDENNNDATTPVQINGKLSRCCGKAVQTPCSAHIRDEVFRYTQLGLGVEVLKALACQLDQLKVDPLGVLLRLPMRIDCNLTAFLISYSGLYRVR